MVDLLHQGFMLFERLRLQVLDDELKCLQVAGQRDLNAFIIADAFDDWSEVSYGVVGPLLVQHDFLITKGPALDHNSDFCEIERLLVHHLNG